MTPAHTPNYASRHWRKSYNSTNWTLSPASSPCLSEERAFKVYTLKKYYFAWKITGKKEKGPAGSRRIQGKAAPDIPPKRARHVHICALKDTSTPVISPSDIYISFSAKSYSQHKRKVYSVRSCFQSPMVVFSEGWRRTRVHNQPRSHVFKMSYLKIRGTSSAVASTGSQLPRSHVSRGWRLSHCFFLVHQISPISQARLSRNYHRQRAKCSHFSVISRPAQN